MVLTRSRMLTDRNLLPFLVRNLNRAWSIHQVVLAWATRKHASAFVRWYSTPLLNTLIPCAYPTKGSWGVNATLSWIYLPSLDLCKAAQQICSSPALKTQWLLVSDCWILIARSYKSRLSVMIWCTILDRPQQPSYLEWGSMLLHNLLRMSWRALIALHCWYDVYMLYGLQERFCSSSCRHDVSIIFFSFSFIFSFCVTPRMVFLDVVLAGAGASLLGARSWSGVGA